MNLENIPKSEPSKIGALLLQCVKTKENETEPHYDVSEAFIPICSFRKPFKGNTFSFTETHIKNFILSCIVPIMRDYGDSGTNPEKRPITRNVLKELVENSRLFPEYL